MRKLEALRWPAVADEANMLAHGPLRRSYSVWPIVSTAALSTIAMATERVDGVRLALLECPFDVGRRCAGHHLG
jgi:hypothetical protein